MSESYKEQHPLLYEDLSDEEQFSPRYQRQFRPMVFRGRSRSKVKGAAAVIRLWPEHWSSSVAYWWMGIGMIALITFVVYNIVASAAVLPPATYKEMRMRALNDAVTPALDNSLTSFNVYMHVFIENNQEIDLNSYLPYIDIIANKYLDFKYHLILVHNDTTSNTNILSAEENNEKAFDSLWAGNSVHQSPKNNVNVEHVALSKLMEKSPLRQDWKHIPKQFIEFLTRATSIWDKGGIAFNPTILTPRSPHSIYIEKLQNILKNFHRVAKKTLNDRKATINHHPIMKKKVNNIRDIIDAMEHDDDDLPLHSSIDSDVKKSASVGPKQSRDSMFSNGSNTSNLQKTHPKLAIIDFKNKTSMDNKKMHDSQETLMMAESKSNFSIQPAESINGTFGILPMFLEFLFRNKADLSTPTSVSRDDSITVTRKRKHVLPDHMNRSFDQEPSDNLKKETKNLEVVFNSAKHTHAVNNESFIETSKANNVNQLTIDLKGNIVSSEVSCHAFLGTMFSNAVHSNPQESITDFIIAELSIFCRGVLSSCNGIDVILP
ncbi:uncharacterized protein LOC114362583 [Ostrinia furnacalis]|uniref:uncharacterized protein LOC114362583 n=1 Tax=Ostrinia furnacalis TaxID=93504 RepID=UPI00103C7A86|nr:uncharacterized protein LOC114362583 [Ostrinia furnacalis]XP_028173837.1 uncharacterized protein LOC114362583 [Ostrinia furnacalis]